MSLFERYLSLWVALCIVAGVALGHLMPGLFATIASAEIARVNLPVAGLVWLMMMASGSQGEPHARECVLGSIQVARGDDDVVYALDVFSHRCSLVLRTRHYNCVRRRCREPQRASVALLSGLTP